jgi:hypothetical protein
MTKRIYWPVVKIDKHNYFYHLMNVNFRKIGKKYLYKLVNFYQHFFHFYRLLQIFTEFTNFNVVQLDHHKSCIYCFTVINLPIL